MREYSKYSDDYLFKSLGSQVFEYNELNKALQIIPQNSVLAYLSVSMSMKRVNKKIMAIRGVLTGRGYKNTEIDARIDF